MSGTDHRCSTNWATRSHGSWSWAIKMVICGRWTRDGVTSKVGSVSTIRHTNKLYIENVVPTASSCSTPRICVQISRLRVSGQPYLAYWRAAATLPCWVTKKEDKPVWNMFMKKAVISINNFAEFFFFGGGGLLHKFGRVLLSCWLRR